jgi:hypothetical protein
MFSFSKSSDIGGRMDGYIAVCAREFIRYLNKKTFLNIYFISSLIDSLKIEIHLHSMTNTLTVGWSKMTGMYEVDANI